MNSSSSLSAKCGHGFSVIWSYPRCTGDDGRLVSVGEDVDFDGGAMWCGGDAGPTSRCGGRAAELTALAIKNTYILWPCILGLSKVPDTLLCLQPSWKCCRRVYTIQGKYFILYWLYRVILNMGVDKQCSKLRFDFVHPSSRKLCTTLEMRERILNVRSQNSKQVYPTEWIYKIMGYW